MNLSFPGARPKISFLRPVSRENFANALGQTCIHDLRMRLKKNDIRDVGSTADLVLVLLVHLVHWYLVHGLIGTSGALVPGTLVPTVT